MFSDDSARVGTYDTFYGYGTVGTESWYAGAVSWYGGYGTVRWVRWVRRVRWVRWVRYGGYGTVGTHVNAIAETPVPPDLIQETEAAAKAKAKAKPAPKQPPRPSATPRSPRLRRYVLQSQLVRRNNHRHHHQDVVEKIAEATHIAAMIGTTLDTTGTDVGDNPD